MDRGFIIIKIRKLRTPLGDRCELVISGCTYVITPEQAGRLARRLYNVFPKQQPTMGTSKPKVFRRRTLPRPMKRKKDIIQLLNPRTHRYVKVDRARGAIISHKPTKGPYKNIPIIEKPTVERINLGDKPCGLKVGLRE